MPNFWINAQGTNTLKGSHEDPRNKPFLPDYLILEFLREQQAARDGLTALLPTMLPEEQERLNALIASDPRCMVGEEYDQIVEDKYQNKMNDLRINNANRGLPVSAPSTREWDSGLVIHVRRR